MKRSSNILMSWSKFHKKLMDVIISHTLKWAAVPISSEEDSFTCQIFLMFIQSHFVSDICFCFKCFLGIVSTQKRYSGVALTSGFQCSAMTL